MHVDLDTVGQAMHSDTWIVYKSKYGKGKVGNCPQ